LADGVNAHEAILDGEMVALDDKGRPSFSLLQQGGGALSYVVFDVLQVDGRDVTSLPYQDRRRLLEELVEPGPHWLVSPRHPDGEALMDAAKARELEGIMAKRVDSTYEIGRRSGVWRKVKYRPQQEFVVGGWVPGTGSREHTMGAILVGVYEGRKLRFAGRVGTGFKERELQRLMARFAELASDVCPFDPPPPRSTSRIARWMRPEMVVEVAFAEWTHEDILRQSSYLGERDDKNPKKVVRQI
jgi:bifunctional non-homologous end joining protein LigD